MFALLMITLSNVETRGGEENPPSVRPASGMTPEVKNSLKGVSVEYALYADYSCSQACFLNPLFSQLRHGEAI